jgi:ribosome-associated heat shock protein Hsp15
VLSRDRFALALGPSFVGEFAPMLNTPQPDGLRLDKWLWAARFYKTRALAVEQISKGRVAVNGLAAKPARELRIGDLVDLRQGDVLRTVRVQALAALRGPASQAQLLYAETAQSITRRQRAAQLRQQGVEPAHTLTEGRPTKRDRRELVDWQRWSASADDVEP